MEKIREEERPAALVARNLRDFTKMLRDEMAREEETLLDPNVIRDDMVDAELEAG